jgi:hypothetical protein
MAIGREGNVKWVDVSLDPRFLLVSGLELLYGKGTDDEPFPPPSPRNRFMLPQIVDLDCLHNTRGHSKVFIMWR